MGKLEAYALTPIPQMTVPGNVVDHIVLGYHKLMAFAEEEGLDAETALALGHILVSHHGRREYGSPVLPSTAEAMIVSAADDLDFKVFYWHSQIESLDDKHDITDYIPLLERRFWRGIKPNEDTEPQSDNDDADVGTLGEAFAEALK